MTTVDQELTGQHVAAGGDRPDLHANRVARAVVARDTVRTVYNDDKKVGINPPTPARWPSSSTQPKDTSSTSPTMSANGQS